MCNVLIFQLCNREIRCNMWCNEWKNLVVFSLPYEEFVLKENLNNSFESQAANTQNNFGLGGGDVFSKFLCSVVDLEMTIERFSDYLVLSSLFIIVFFIEKQDRNIAFLWSHM